HVRAVRDDPAVDRRRCRVPRRSGAPAEPGGDELRRDVVGTDDQNLESLFHGLPPCPPPARGAGASAGVQLATAARSGTGGSAARPLRIPSATCCAETMTGVIPPPGRVQWPTHQRPPTGVSKPGRPEPSCPGDISQPSMAPWRLSVNRHEVRAEALLLTTIRAPIPGSRRSR